MDGCQYFSGDDYNTRTDYTDYISSVHSVDTQSFSGLLDREEREFAEMFDSRQISVPISSSTSTVTAGSGVVTEEQTGGASQHIEDDNQYIMHDHLNLYQEPSTNEIENESLSSVGEASCEDGEELSPYYATRSSSSTDGMEHEQVTSIGESTTSFRADILPDVIREQQQILDQIREEEESMKLSRFLAQQIANEDLRDNTCNHGVKQVDQTSAQHDLHDDGCEDSESSDCLMKTIQEQEFIRSNIHQQQEAEKADFKLAAQLADMDLQDGKKMNQNDLIGIKQAISALKKSRKSPASSAQATAVHVKETRKKISSNPPHAREESPLSSIEPLEILQQQVAARQEYQISERIVKRNGRNIRMTVFSEEIP